MIVDEAQYIKNANTQNSKAIKAIEAQTRYALTGTPIENSLAELWSIFDYIMPGYLFSYRKFKQNYETPIIKDNDELKKNSDLEKEVEELRAERDSLQTSLNEYLGSTYDGTILSTDTKYIAFENTLDNISFTEEQYNNAINELMTKNDIDLSNNDIDDPVLSLNVRVFDNNNKLKIEVKKNDIVIGSAVYNQSFIKITDADDKDVFTFKGEVDGNKNLIVKYNHADERFKDAVIIKQFPNNIIRATINYDGRKTYESFAGQHDIWQQKYRAYLS
jgi:hypothetical protein